MCCCGDIILLVYKFMKLLFQSGLNLKNKVDKEPHLLFLHLAVWEIYDAACLKHIISPSVSNCLTSMKEEKWLWDYMCKWAWTCSVLSDDEGHINHWWPDKDMWKGHLKSTGTIRWKGNLKINDRGTRGQISPAAVAAGCERATGEVVGSDGGTMIDSVWQILISYQLYLWGNELRFRNGLDPWCYRKRDWP